MITFTELRKYLVGYTVIVLDSNDDVALYRAEYYFRGNSTYSTYLVYKDTDKYVEISNNRVRTIKGALKSLAA